MRNLVLFFLIFILFSSCNLVVRGVSEKAVEVVENLVEAEDNKPEIKKEGEIISYDSNGKIKTKINYKNSLKNGEAITYYVNGNVKLSVVYKEDIKHGPSFYYYENGKLYRESTYVNGELDGIRKLYEKGRLTSEIPYKNGQTGKGLKEYFTNGNLKKDYPKLEFEEIDTRSTDQTYTLKVKFTESHPKDKFYLGELADGTYLHDELYYIYNENGVGKLAFDIPPNATGGQKINFIGVHHTLLGNSYVTEYEYNLEIN